MGIHYPVDFIQFYESIKRKKKKKRKSILKKKKNKNRFKLLI